MPHLDICSSSFCGHETSMSEDRQIQKTALLMSIKKAIWWIFRLYLVVRAPPVIKPIAAIIAPPKPKKNSKVNVFFLDGE